MKTARVLSAYQRAYADPIRMQAGEALSLGDKKSEWPGWIWCTSRDGKSGWVPAKYVERQGNAGVALCDYDAAELSVRAGQVLSLGQAESGWVWCMNPEGQSGWVPLECLERATG